jgi:hypothetical protein
MSLSSRVPLRRTPGGYLLATSCRVRASSPRASGQLMGASRMAHPARASGSLGDGRRTTAVRLSSGKPDVPAHCARMSLPESGGALLARLGLRRGWPRRPFSLRAGARSRAWASCVRPRPRTRVTATSPRAHLVGTLRGTPWSRRRSTQAKFGARGAPSHSFGTALRTTIFGLVKPKLRS